MPLKTILKKGCIPGQVPYSERLLLFRHLPLMLLINGMHVTMGERFVCRHICLFSFVRERRLIHSSCATNISNNSTPLHNALNMPIVDISHAGEGESWY